MRKTRIIPQLLILEEGVYKTTKFSNPNYIGDPINTIKLFNELEADEIVIVDIDTTKKNSELDYDFIEEIVSEAFMPVTYGGGIKSIKDAKLVLQCGVEKILINNLFIKNPEIIMNIQSEIGSQSIVVSIDVFRDKDNSLVLYDYVKCCNTNILLLDAAIQAENLGAGELLITSVNHDGTYRGLDLEILNALNNKIKVPIIISGGASSKEDFIDAQKHGASGIAAGSMFIYHGKNRGILINYPKQSELNKILE